MDQPRWLELAWADLGVAEAPGAANNPRVARYYADAGHPEVGADEVAWCAAFVGACLERAGIAGTRSLMARSYLAWGDALAEPRAGAVAVLSRGSDPSLGHVGFLVGRTTDAVILLAGNQGDGVSVAPFPRSRLLGLRWPAGAAAVAAPPSPPVIPEFAPANIRDPALDATFERALAHVLEMEGGYDEDPYDPGGPTNLGITLAEFDATLALASEIDRSMPPLVPPQPKGPAPMPTENQPATPSSEVPEAKWWGHSLTIWGVVVTTLATVLPAMGPAIGLNITGELIRQLGDNVVTFAQAAGGLIGTVMAIYGRIRSSTPLQRRQITLSM